MTRSVRCAVLFTLFVCACRPCDDDCREYIGLSFFSPDATGAFTSARYTVIVDADGQAATCTIDVNAALNTPTRCQGEATIAMGNGGTEDDTSGGTADGRLRIFVRWNLAPTTFNVVVRDAANVLVLDNTLTPAYQDQNVDACDGECRLFVREVTLAE